MAEYFGASDENAVEFGASDENAVEFGDCGNSFDDADQFDRARSDTTFVVL